MQAQTNFEKLKGDKKIPVKIMLKRIFKYVKPEQLFKKSSPTVATESGIAINVKEQQPSKAWWPIFINLAK